MKHTVFFDPDLLFAQGAPLNASKKQEVNEEFRAIKRAILQAAFEHGSTEPNRNRVMVTSLGEQEGKTFTAVNLAMSIAMEQNKYVMLVDTNVLSPSIADMATPTPEFGLIDYLNDITQVVDKIIYPTNIDRLRLLPIGRLHAQANELLNGKQMADLMDDFLHRYNDRVVIFDAPPLLGVNEAMTLSAHVDQIIVVVEDGTVWERDLLELQNHLPKNVIVHYVLNKAPKGRRWKSLRKMEASMPSNHGEHSGVHGSNALL